MDANDHIVDVVGGKAYIAILTSKRKIFTSGSSFC